MQIMDV